MTYTSADSFNNVGYPSKYWSILLRCFLVALLIVICITLINDRSSGYGSSSSYGGGRSGSRFSNVVRGMSSGSSRYGGGGSSNYGSSKKSSIMRKMGLGGSSSSGKSRGSEGIV